MKEINLESWKRKDHYNYFKQLDYPHFNLCGNLDITEFYSYIKGNGLPFFLSVVFASTKTANSIPEFRLRIRNDQLIEHDIVNPSFTIMTTDHVFSFCSAKFIDNYHDFLINAEAQIEKTKKHAVIKDEPGKDDLLYITSIPWISFTSVTHPIQMHPTDCIPRITWGKFFDQNGKILLPFSVQAHHALVDGIHVGQYFSTIQEIFHNPQQYL